MLEDHLKRIGKSMSLRCYLKIYENHLKAARQELRDMKKNLAGPQSIESLKKNPEFWRGYKTAVDELLGE